MPFQILSHHQHRFPVLIFARTHEGDICSQPHISIDFLPRKLKFVRREPHILTASRDRVGPLRRVKLRASLVQHFSHIRRSLKNSHGARLCRFHWARAHPLVNRNCHHQSSRTPNRYPPLPASTQHVFPPASPSTCQLRSPRTHCQFLPPHHCSHEPHELDTVCSRAPFPGRQIQFSEGAVRS